MGRVFPECALNTQLLPGSGGFPLRPPRLLFVPRPGGEDISRPFQVDSVLFGLGDETRAWEAGPASPPTWAVVCLTRCRPSRAWGQRSGSQRWPVCGCRPCPTPGPSNSWMRQQEPRPPGVRLGLPWAPRLVASLGRTLGRVLPPEAHSGPSPESSALLCRVTFPRAPSLVTLSAGCPDSRLGPQPPRLDGGLPNVDAELLPGCPDQPPTCLLRGGGLL